MLFILYFSNWLNTLLISSMVCLIKIIIYKMKIVIPVLLFLLPLALSISQYDFNACRISNCNAEEINCLSDESGCLNYFATMRSWYFLLYIVFRVAEAARTGTPAGAVARTPRHAATPITSVCPYATKMSAISQDNGSSSLLRSSYFFS